MSTTASESFDSYGKEETNEHGEEDDEGNEEDQLYSYSNFYCPEEDDEDNSKFLYPKWRNAPRSPSDFAVSKTTISSCRDSDYQRWLEDYYNELVKKNMPSYSEKQCDTFGLIDETRSKNVVEPMFRSYRNEPWEISTKYWGPNESRRHWALRKGRTEYLFFPSIHPDLNLRSRYGRFHSLLYTSAAVPEATHKMRVCSIFKKCVEGMVVQNPKLLKILNCDNLYNLKYYDFMTKTAVMRTLCKFFKTQHHLEKVYFENSDLRRLEAIILLCALSRSGGRQIKELHMWKMFGYGQSPLLLNELPEKVNASQKKSMEFFTRIHYLQILYKFSSLTHLSVNYAYLANREGDALLCVKSLRIGVLRELRILCLKEERPLLTNPGYGVGGWLVPDGVWRRATEWCPKLRVKFVFLNMPQYENIVVFLSKSIPVSSVTLSSGPDFDFETPWDLDSTLLELRNWYSTTLESLSLHLWHHRDLLDFVIKAKILEEFPNLLNFEFIGVLEDLETLNEFCCRVSKGTYKLKTFLFWVQEQHADRKKLRETRRRVEEIRETFRKRFLVLDVDADIGTYAV